MSDKEKGKEEEGLSAEKDKEEEQQEGLSAGKGT